MHPQLAVIIDEFHTASERLRRLAEAVPDEFWPQRPATGSWSISECVAHLNLTGEAFLPSLRAAIEQGRKTGEGPPARLRRDPIGWLLWRTMGPPVRMRVKTAPTFIPQAAAPPEEIRREFERLQAEQIACVEAAEGVPLHRIRIRSPFDARVRYTLYSALTILPRHQHRHLWQAEQVRPPRAGRAGP